MSRLPAMIPARASSVCLSLALLMAAMAADAQTVPARKPRVRQKPAPVQPAPVPAPVAPAPVPVPAPAPLPAPVAAPAPAAAPVAPAAAVVPAARTALYLTAGLGVSSWSLDSAPGVQVDSSGDAFRVGIGYALSPDVALELGFVNLGRARASSATQSVSYKADGFGLDVVGNWGLSPSWALHGKLGAFFAGTRLSPGASEHALGLKYGAGLSYGLDTRLRATFDMESFPLKAQYEDGSSDSGRTSAFTLGLRWSL